MKDSLRARMAREAVALFAPDQKLRKAIQPVKPTALRNLAQAAAAAEVSEEMEIVLQYQAAREVIPKDVSQILLGELYRLRDEDYGGAAKAFSELMGQVVRLHRSLEGVSR